MAVIEHQFTSTDTWELLSDDQTRVIVSNKSGQPIELTVTFTSDVPADTGLVTYDIGGFIDEFTGPPAAWIWGRCASLNGIARVREYGTLDPEADISSLAIEVNNLNVKFEAHKGDRDNVDHQVTKEQVGLGDIPNLVLDTVDDVPGTDAVASPRSVFTVATALLDHVDTKVGNPHEVTKEEVGLGDVVNAPFATMEEHVDNTVEDKYVHPKGMYAAIVTHTAVAYSSEPQIVVHGKTKARPSGWNYDECDAPTELITLKDAGLIEIQPELIVTYAHDYKARLSLELLLPIEVVVPTLSNGIQYVYVDMDDLGNIASGGVTDIIPKAGTTREGAFGDFFNTAECQMYDVNENKIKRTYIGKVFVSGGVITDIVSVPTGRAATVAVATEIAQNQRLIVVNPFIDPVMVDTEVKYDDVWGDPGWNDQIGIKANTYPNDPLNYLVIQSGLMGTLAPGNESGCAFGLSFLTVTTPLRTRLKLQKRG